MGFCVQLILLARTYRAGAAAGRISTALEFQSNKALQESVRSLEVANQRAESALALAKEAEQKVH